MFFCIFIYKLLILLSESIFETMRNIVSVVLFLFLSVVTVLAQEGEYCFNKEHTFRPDKRIDYSSPYTMFGDTTKVLTTVQEQNLEHVLEIPLMEEGTRIGMLEMDMKTGMVNLKDVNGIILSQKLLNETDQAQFLTMDRYAEKYYSISPYAFCANNPLKYTDPTGDSISVAEEYRDYLYKDLTAVFGDYAENFSFTSTGMLVYNGSTKGMNKDQKAAFKGLNQVMNDKETTGLLYANAIEFLDQEGNKLSINSDQVGNAFTMLKSENTFLDKNYILINPTFSGSINVEAITKSYFDPSIGGSPYQTEKIQTNRTDGMFHELGHIIVGQGTQDKVINYNNHVRRAIGLPNRPYDRTHNKYIRGTY